MKILNTTGGKAATLGGLNLAALIRLVTLYFNVIAPKQEAYYKRKAEVDQVIADMKIIRGLILTRAQGGDRLSAAALDKLSLTLPPPAEQTPEKVREAPGEALDYAIKSVESAAAQRKD